jgi:hypothetical protein
MLRVARIVVGLVGLVLAVSPVRAGDCQKADFESVVDVAAGSLRDLNAANRPPFQDKLRLLKERRGWTHEQFVKAAEPFVRDDVIIAYDIKSNNLLARIAAGGEAGAAAATPDCVMLSNLQASMKVLVETQTAKWAYMTAKIDAELAKP